MKKPVEEESNNTRPEQNDFQKTIVSRVLTRKQELESARQNWTRLWRECSNYALPRIEDKIDTIVTEGKEHSDLYDSTAQIYAEKLANSMFTFMTPSTVKWFSWSTGDSEFDKNAEVAEFLKKVETIMYDGLDKTNFYPQMHESFLDSVVLGTSVVFTEKAVDKKKVVNFHASPIFKNSLGCNPQNDVDTIYTQYDLTGYQICQRFPNMENDRQIKSDPNRLYRIVHAIEPRENFFQNNAPLGVKPFVSYMVLEERQVLLSDIKDGYNSFPAGIGMFYRSTDEIYGRSPTMRCLADIRSLNLLRKSYLTGTQLASAPPLQVKHNSIVANRVVFSPFGLTYVKGDSEIKPLISGARPDIGDGTIQRLQESVGFAFYQDTMNMTRKTHQLEAQIDSFSDEQVRTLSAVFVRMSRMIEVIMNRMFEIYDAEGLIPEAPEALREKPDIVIRYKSQLARAQKQGDVNAIIQAVQMAGAVGQIDPQALNAIDGTEAVRVILETLDVDRRIFRSDEEVKQATDAQNKEREANQNIENEKTQSETIKNLQG